jgi:hypothetical protein
MFDESVYLSPEDEEDEHDAGFLYVSHDPNLI